MSQWSGETQTERMCFTTFRGSSTQQANQTACRALTHDVLRLESQPPVFLSQDQTRSAAVT